MNLNLRKNAPTVLTILGTAGVLSTSFLSWRAGYKTSEKKNEIGLQQWGQLSFLKKASKVAKPHIQALCSGLATVGCFWGANTISMRTQASLMASIEMLRNSYSSYLKKEKEIFGQDANDKVLNAMKTEDKGLHDILESQAGIEIRDDYYGVFHAKLSQLLLAQNELNRTFIGIGRVDLASLYSYIGTSITKQQRKVYSSIGWDQYIGETVYGYSFIDFSHTIQEDPMTGEQYLHLQYPFPPTEDCINPGQD